MTEHEITTAAFDRMFEGEKLFYDTSDLSSLINGAYDGFLDEELVIGNGTQASYDYGQPDNFDIFCGEIQPTVTAPTPTSSTSPTPAASTSSVPSFNPQHGSYDRKNTMTPCATEDGAHDSTSFASGSSPTRPFMAPPPPAMDYAPVMTQAPMAIPPGLSDDDHFHTERSPAHDATTSTARPAGAFPTSEFTFSVLQPPYHFGVIWPASSYLERMPQEYNPGFALDAPSGVFPPASPNFLYSSFAQMAPNQCGALHPVQPTASGSNPHSGLGQPRRRPDDDGAAATQQQPPKKRRRVNLTATSTLSSTSSTPTSPPTPSLSSASSSSSDSSSTTSTSSSSTPSVQSSTNWIKDPDGRFRCLLCTAEPVFADTEKDIVRHLDTAEAHHPGKVRCGDTIYRCPCGKGLLGKRLDAQKRHVRGYITSERKRAIKLEDGRRLYNVNAYEARLKSEKLL